MNWKGSEKKPWWPVSATVLAFPGGPEESLGGSNCTPPGHELLRGRS
jgi:hypothetical protein